MSKNTKNYLNQYRDELLHNVIPFWMKHSKDEEYGGFFTCLTREGEVFETDKFVWLQGRETWFFSMLYNNLEQKQEWLDFAEHGADFLKKTVGQETALGIFHLLEKGSLWCSLTISSQIVLQLRLLVNFTKLLANKSTQT